MRTILAKFLPATLLAMAFALPAAAQEKLTVYTYESFTAEWGPGPAVEKAFEAECKCDLQFVAVADGVAILNRLKLEGASTQADIALGLDTNLTWEARQSGIFAPHGVTAARLAVPGGWSDDTFLPFDYGYFAVKNKVHIHDLHATILHLLGINHLRFTYRFQGRDFRLTDVHGNVVHDILT